MFLTDEKLAYKFYKVLYYNTQVWICTFRAYNLENAVKKAKEINLYSKFILQQNDITVYKNY